ncbi:MAG: flotillin family protein [Planctomycetota bacterium]
MIAVLLQGAGFGGAFGTFAVIGVVVLIVVFFTVLLVRQYRRCPSNRILVVYGRVGGARAAKCLHGGGTFVVPLVQDYEYLSLEPLTIDIELTGALSKKNIRVNVPSTFTIGISTEPEIMNAAAERLLGMTDQQISAQARDIILGQMRLVLATLGIEEINQDREKFLDLVNKNVGYELNKIGLDVINVNIRDITDESGYIEAIGRKAASEAINQAKIEVAEQEKLGNVGQAGAVREMDVNVATQRAQSAMGQKMAERDQRVSVAKYEAEGITGEAAANREKEVAVAEQAAKAVQGQKAALTEQRIRVAQLEAGAAQGEKEAQAEQRIKIAAFEASAVEGENNSKAVIAKSVALLAEAQAIAKRQGDVALANASRDVFQAQTQEEQARLEKTEVVQKEIDKRKVEIDAEARAEQVRRIGKGEADAILFKYSAEAEGVRLVLEAKAAGYRKLVEMSGAHPEMAPTLLLIEKLPELVAEQVKAIQNLKIDKITIWDGQGGGAGGGRNGNATAAWLRDLIGALPPIHELARQAGVKLPSILGTVDESDGATGGGEPGSHPVKAPPAP